MAALTVTYEMQNTNVAAIVVRVVINPLGNP